MFHYSQGKHTTQGHKGIPEGHYEEEMGRKGFSGPVSHLIKPEPSTRWTSIEGPLRPQLFDCVKLPQQWGQWQRLLYNNDVTISYLWEKKTQGTVTKGFRNADGETLYFVHAGKGSVVTDFGLLEFRRGHYIMIPKCVGHTFICEEDTQFLVIESRSSQFREPDRGMVGRNAFYDTEALARPDLQKQIDLKKSKAVNVTEMFVKRKDQQTRFTYSDCVFDAVGWKGDFFPFTLHVDDMMPMLSARVHLPPSAHATFVAHNFVICTFLPRPLESDKDALKVPFYHQNIDYDEVLFYHDGNFFSRDNLHAGMMSFHPAGFPHGPHPKAVQKIDQKTHTDEYAVMIDTWNPLNVDPGFEKTEVKEYWQSWMK
ncbi:MAG: homogentisate 1,2-dioxygenase [Oligoflexia bacterium]|nr:MAG: homogentisate 1,2-dioxygenase [Oligoflexia bacterium]